MEPTSLLKILSFKNCELHCCHLDGYKEQRDTFLRRLADIETFFAEKPSNNKYRIWYNIDETYLDNALLDEIAASLVRMNSHILKIAFIGLRRTQQSRLTKIFKNCKFIFPYGYFSDAEKAKEWLV